MAIDPLMIAESPLRYVAAASRARRKKRDQSELTPEERRSLQSSLIGGSLGGLSWLAETLDKPGRAIRGTASGLMGGDWGGGLLNLLPLSDTVGITDPTQGVTGRDLLETAGVLAKNRPGLDAGDVAGVGAEILLDPLTYLTFGGSALSKAGRVGKAAGLLDDAALVARRTQGLGPRQFKMRSTLDDLLKSGSEAEQATKLQRAKDAARGMGLESIDELRDQRLGSLVGFGAPFRESSALLGTGKLADKAAGWLDTAGRAVREGNIPGTKYSPGRHLSELFASDVQGAASAAGQQYGRELSAGQRRGSAEVRKTQARLAREFKGYEEGEGLKRVLEGVENPDELAGEARQFALAEQSRRIVEGVDPVPDVLQGPLDEADQVLAGQLKSYRRLGGATQRLRDESIKYWPRRKTGGFENRREARLFNAFDPSSIHRYDALKDLPEGTELINEISRAVRPLVEENAKTKEIAEFIQQNFGDRVPPTLLKRNKAGQVLRDEAGQPIQVDRYKAIAGILRPQDQEVLGKGLFGNHPVADFSAATSRRSDAIRALDVATQAIADHGELLEPGAAVPKGFVKVTSLLKKLGAKTGFEGVGLKNLPEGFEPDDVLASIGKDLDGALFEVARKRGQDAATSMLEEVIPIDLAKDLLRFHEGFTSPEAVNKLVEAIDTVNHLFKAGVLTWPARYVRDLTSGTYQNWMAGLIEAKRMPAAVGDAAKLLRGETVKGAAGIPEVQRILASRGLPATDDAGSAVLREMASAYELTSRGPTAQITAASVGDVQPKTLNDLLNQIPGETPFSWKRVAKTAIGQDPQTATSYNPLDIYGVAGRTETKFAPVVAGNQIGFWTDAMNRVAPFLEQLRKGVDPLAAATKIKAAQVDYSAKALTQFERSVLAKVFPFYRFLKGSTPFTVKTLLERPGGRLGQTVRVLDAGRDPSEIVPDYVSETASFRIPENMPLLGGGPGSDPRFVTGLGLMFEDALGFMGGPHDVAFELASRLNPILKGPLEYTSGTSFFQKGTGDGGRELGDLDPLLGRLMSNITGAEEPYQLPRLLETTLANSPASRLLTTAKTLTDRRKRIPGTVLPGPAAWLNVASGARITDVPEKVQDAILREKAAQEMLATGAKTFEKVYFSDEAVERMSPEDQAQAARLDALQTLLAERASERAKKRKKLAGRL